MIHLDYTKTSARHSSGLIRVNRRLREELGAEAHPVDWRRWNRRVDPEDWFLTAELFSEAERPGFAAFVASRPCRLAAIFHDAIPLRLPHVTWPQSVARQPAYMKMLASFDRVFAVSEASRRDLTGFWRWQGVEPRAATEVLALGADFDGGPRQTHALPAARPALLCVGIIEPRKNQGFLLDVCERLWDGGLDFDLHVVGRVNPVFGRDLARRLEQTAARHTGLRLHGPVDDHALARLLEQSWAVVFPTLAEGCGLPLLEALWNGRPGVCSDLPVLRETADGGGCLVLPAGDGAAWQEGLHRILTDTTLWRRLAAAAAARPLASWRDTAGAVLARCGSARPAMAAAAAALVEPLRGAGT